MTGEWNSQNNDVGQVQNRINNLSSMYEEFFECQYRIEHLESLLRGEHTIKHVFHTCTRVHVCQT
jgi:hypothetical protein